VAGKARSLIKLLSSSSSSPRISKGHRPKKESACSSFFFLFKHGEPRTPSLPPRRRRRRLTPLSGLDRLQRRLALTPLAHRVLTLIICMVYFTEILSGLQRDCVRCTISLLVWVRVRDLRMCGSPLVERTHVLSMLPPPSRHVGLPPPIVAERPQPSIKI
jgi:hypothetical protein